jgi:hypothetical protein
MEKMLRASIATSVVLASSFLVIGCGSLNRAESSRLLEERAGYGGPAKNDISFQEGGVEGFRNSPVPTRSRARIAAVYAHPHEMPSRDYFWGGWISVVVEQDQWVMSDPKLVPKAKAVEELPLFLNPGKNPIPIELMPERNNNSDRSAK